MIDQEVFKQQMALLADRIGRQLAGPTQLEYYRHLSAALTTEQFIGAMTLAFRRCSGEYRTWPSPQELIELIAPVAAPAIGAHEMFERVLSITNDPRRSAHEQREQIQALGATAFRAFMAAGGIRDFRDVLEANIPWLRKRFVEIYDEVCEHADAEREATLALNDAGDRLRQLAATVATARVMPAERKLVEAGR